MKIEPVKDKSSIIEIAKNTIRIERNALDELEKSIDDHFPDCVEVIFQTKGRVVVTGIGKSALIGQKIVATFNSTGTPSIFMHAADAIHGDLGMIQPDDIVLAISKSGETPEIKVLAPLLKNLGNKLIGMVSQKNSFLATQADHILYTPVDQEADPNNLAPTASTTAQMAMGDALATSLLALRGFTPSDFAQFHPGGALGKQLYLRVSDLYVNNERPFVYEDQDLRETILEMTSKRLGVTVVLNQAEEITGIITDGDLRRMMEHRAEIDGVKAVDIMSRQPKTIGPDEMAVKALDIMRENSITQLVVSSDRKYLGIVHLHDLIREGLI